MLVAFVCWIDSRTVTRRVIMQSDVRIKPGYAGADTVLVLRVELCINPFAVQHQWCGAVYGARPPLDAAHAPPP